MAGSVVFVFPSHYESWGIAALEAMAAGLPVVGYDIPSSREAFGEAMLRVPPYDVEAFADAVLRCLLDADTRETYRARGLGVAQKHDWDVVAQQFARSVLD
jgi:glycosyltransferase involved in cell wall biosynthesis